MANNNPDFHGGVADTPPPTYLGEGTKKVDLSKKFSEPINSQRTPKGSPMDNQNTNSGPGPVEDEASHVDPDLWDSRTQMSMSSKKTSPTTSSQRSGTVPTGGNQLREVNPVTDDNVEPHGNVYPSSGKGSSFSSGVGQAPANREA